MTKELIHFIGFSPKLDKHVDLYFKSAHEARERNPEMIIKRAEDWEDAQC